MLIQTLAGKFALISSLGQRGHSQRTSALEGEGGVGGRGEGGGVFAAADVLF